MIEKKNAGGNLLSFSFILWDILIGNGLFLICNLPIALLFIFLKINRAFLLIVALYIVSFNLMPSFTALLYAYNKKDETNSIISLFFKGYKSCFAQALKAGLLFNLLLMILYVDYLYFSKINGIAGFVFLFLLLIVVGFGISYATVIANFNFSLRQIFEIILKFFAEFNRSALLTVAFTFFFVSMYFSGASFILWAMFAMIAKICVSSSKTAREKVFYYHTEEGRKLKNL